MRAQVADDLLGAWPVALVDHEDVGDLQDPGLGRLDRVAHPRRDDHQRGVGQRGDLDLGLADADGLDADHVEAGRVEHPQRLRRRHRQPAEMPAAGHRPDEHAAVGGVILHPDPVAEQRAAGERRGRVDGEHPDPQTERAVGAHERAGHRRLPDARRAGQPDDAGVTRVRRDRAHHRPRAPAEPFSTRETSRASDRASPSRAAATSASARRVLPARQSVAAGPRHPQQQGVALAAAAAQRGRAEPAAAPPSS